MTTSPTKNTAPPAHHPLEEALVEYAGGTTPGSGALAFACHVSLCDVCARRLAELEAVGGALMDSAPAQALAADALERAMAGLDAAGVAEEAPPPLPAFLAPYRLPRPLERVVAALPGRVRWRFGAPGVRTIDLSSAARAGDESRVRLVSFKPGVVIPPHDHKGTEHIVIFTGAIEEEGRRLGRGDIATRERGERHEQRIAAGEPCIALVVNEGPLVPLTLRGRLLLAFARG
jgi:putative transcriptional regulator